MKSHFYGDLLLLSLSTTMHWRGGHPVMLIYAVVLTILGILFYDFINIGLCLVWRTLQGKQVAFLMLLLDCACIMYAGALLYAQRSQEQIKCDITTLRSSRFVNRPA